MKTQTIAQSFASYRDQVIPRDASTEQVEECRRAFYGGAYILLMNIAHNIGDETTSEEDGIAQLEKLKAECEAYAAGVGDQPATPPVPDMNYTTADAAEFRPLLQDLGERIGRALPMGWGFNLMLFQYGEGGSLFYIASAAREEVIKLMREFILRNTQ